MKRVSRRAYAKINLGLDVLGRRPDGYHDVRMIMQQVDLFDELVLEARADGKVSMDCDKPDLPCDASNLCARAAELMRSHYGLSEGVHIALTKRIPLAAGLAGGSADAAAVMRGMADLFLDDPNATGAMDWELRELAPGLGADIPYCLMGGTALAEGIGEVLTPIAPALREIPTLLVKPLASVSTGEVYRALDTCPAVRHPDIDGLVRAIRGESYRGLCRGLGNVLEEVTIPMHPEIRQLKDCLMDGGADAALMSGSGPTVFAFFSDTERLESCRRQLEDRREDLGIAHLFASRTR